MKKINTIGRYRNGMKKIVISAMLAILILLFSIMGIAHSLKFKSDTSSVGKDNDYIKWIDYTVPALAMQDALTLDTETYRSEHHYRFSDILAYFASRNGGDFSEYGKNSIKNLRTALTENPDIDSLSPNKKLYEYYKEAYRAVLGGMVGEYIEVKVSPDGTETREEKYGLRVFSPLADGYWYQDYDDFGASRSYGYKRSHLGHDMLGSTGTPVIAVESGYVEACGWNQYGGWRIGIRSFDGQRYYYYAHLRKGHPYNDIYEGKIVNAGEVIGYLGMTGYSAKENVNNINIPHLHYGLEIIFDPSQKDGYNQIWVDLYEMTKFLSHNRVKTFKKDNERYSEIYCIYTETPD